MPSQLGQHHVDVLRRQQQQNLENFLNSSQASVMIASLLPVATTGDNSDSNVQVLRLGTAGASESPKNSAGSGRGVTTGLGGRVLWHRSDKAFRPVVGNRAVERRKKRSFNSRSLPVQARTPDEVRWWRHCGCGWCINRVYARIFCFASFHFVLFVVVV